MSAFTIDTTVTGPSATPADHVALAEAPGVDSVWTPELDVDSLSLGTDDVQVGFDGDDRWRHGREAR